jgi:hypothetical protein
VKPKGGARRGAVGPLLNYLRAKAAAEAEAGKS